MKLPTSLFAVSVCAILLSGCTSKTTTATKVSSREDCVNGCYTLWKSTESNKNKTEADMNKDCNSLCDAGQGIQKQDVESCAKAEGILRDTCYGDIAKNTNDPALCEKITSQMIVSTCYISIVEIRKDKSLCEKIPVKMMKDSCLDPQQ